MKTKFLSTPATVALTLAASMLAAQPSTASGSKSAPPTHAAWKAECGSCHVPYPPRLLPAESWRALMDGLERHFGTDATLDATTAASIRAFLEANAGTRRDVSLAQPRLRITETRWFVREHDEVPPAVWRSAKVKSAANCGACHAGADQGRFGEHDVRIPR
jgi:cytochrome c553